MKKTGYKKVAITAAGLLSTVILGALANFYLIGEPIDGNQVYCTASVSGANLHLQVEAAAPGTALHGLSYRQEGNVLYISARKVPVSPLFRKGPCEISVNTERIEKVLFGNRTIWSDSGQI